MGAILSELLNEKELEKINSIKLYGVETEIEVKKMTIEQLSNIACILIESEYDEKIPECIFSSVAINILTQRAIKKGINIF